MARILLIEVTVYSEIDMPPVRPFNPQISRESARMYSIGEAANILGISIPTIRLYEQEGLILPHRRGSNHRRFTESDIERIRCMRRMMSHDRVGIPGIRRLLSMIPCWSINNCPPDLRRTCPAFSQHDLPCWLMRRRSTQCTPDKCRACAVYRDIADCRTLKLTIAEFTAAEPAPTSSSRR